MAPIELVDDSASRNIHHYFLAQYKQIGGALPEAAQHYEAILTSTKAPIQAFKGYTQYLALSNQFSKIIDLQPQLDKNFGKDPAVQMAIAMAMERTGSQDEAIARVITLAEQHPTNQEIIFHAAQAYVARKELENAIAVLDSFIDNSPQKPNLFMFHFFKAQIYLQLNKKNEALASIKKSIKIHPHFDKGWLLCSMLEEQAGNIENAIKGYSTFLDLVGSDSAIQNHLMTLMFKQKMANEKTTVVTISSPCLKQALQLFENKQPKLALDQLEKCLKENPRDTDARILKIQILSSQQQWQQVINLLTAWMTDEPNNQLWFKTLHGAGFQGLATKDLIRTLQTVEKKHPSATLPVMYLADVYLRHHKIPAALHYLKKLTVISNDQLLKTKAFYQMGRLYYEQHQYNLMKSVLEAGYKLSSNFAPLCNLLAYYYAGKGKELIKAQQLIEQALKTEPDNPHYKDTQARIWYKQGDYKKARLLLEPIATNMAHDNVITKHMKKILTHTHDKDQ